MVWIGGGAALIAAIGAISLITSFKKGAEARAPAAREQRGSPAPLPARSPSPAPAVVAAPAPARVKTPAQSAPPPPIFKPARAAPPLPGIQTVDTSKMRQIVDIQFSRNLSGFYRANDARWLLARSKKDGEYQMLCREAGVWFPGEPPLQDLHLKDFVCEVWARIEHVEGHGGWGVGFIGGVPDTQPWSGVMTNENAQISSFPSPQGGDLPWVSTPAMQRGQTNALRIEAFGPRTRVFVNGSFVFERFHERQKPDCGLTIYLYGDHPPEEVRVKSVQVWTPQ